MFAVKACLALGVAFFTEEVSSSRATLQLNEGLLEANGRDNAKYSNKQLEPSFSEYAKVPDKQEVPLVQLKSLEVDSVSVTNGEPVAVASADSSLIPQPASGNPWQGNDIQSKVAGENLTTWEEIQAVVGGTGASISFSGNTDEDMELLRRMRYQDKALMTFLLLAYLGTLLFSASIAYRQAANNSPVVYYADPRFHTATVDGDDIEGFLHAFNQPPKDAQLLVTGFRRVPMFTEEMMDSSQRLGFRQHVAFSFALDLSPWVVRDSSDNQEDPAAGVADEDMEKLTSFLANDTNELAYVEIEKEVSWKDWEELATNIKSHIRQCGFDGRVVVRRNASEVVDVHRNNQWANFMHSRTTKVVVFLSFFGLLLYKPYMMWRHAALRVKCNYRVNMKIDQYWPLIADKIGAEGFNTGLAATVPAATRASRQHLVQQQRRQQAAALAADAQSLESARW